MDCKLKMIFDKQRQLMIKFDEIEKENGFSNSQNCFDINAQQTQHRLRDFSWRVTEELAEAMACLKINHGKRK
jgi:hypothetical protein